jgi:TetR/AcrR family transcriptional regulator, tetracycline repressor protein
VASTRLTTERVVARALEVVDARGADALSMRALAEDLGVTPMALYNHVPGKQALCDAVADRVLAAVSPPAHGPWRVRVRSVLSQVRAAYLAHPHAVPLVQRSTTPSPAMLRPMEAVLGALAEAGLEPADALAGWVALIGLTDGHVAYQRRAHLRAAPTGAVADEHPAAARALALGTFDWDRRFEAALDVHLHALLPPGP